MDIIVSLKKDTIKQIFLNIKPFDFKSCLPAHLEAGNKIYFFETAYDGGSLKVVGEAVVKEIHDLEKMREEGKEQLFFSRFYLQNIKNNVGYFDTNKWLKSIGYYDVEKNKKWNYALELKNIKKYTRLVDITKFIGQDGEKLSKAPQSWCYINKKNK